MKEKYALGIEKAQADPLDPAGSRFYGAPYVPAFLADKYVDDFIFLAQIRLADIAALDPDEILPHEGYLYLFIDAEMYPDESLYAFCEYTTEEPDTLLRGFNARSPIPEGLTTAFPVGFTKVAGNADCTRMGGIPSGDAEVGTLLLQYRPEDFDVPFLRDKNIYLYLSFDKDDELEYIIEHRLTPEGCKFEKDSVLVEMHHIAAANDLKETARMLRPIIEGKEMEYDEHQFYKAPFYAYAEKFVNGYESAADSDAFFVQWAADFIQLLLDCEGVRTTHPYYERAVRVLCREGLRIYGTLPRKNKEQLEAAKDTLEETKGMEFFMGMWSSRGFTEQERDILLNPDFH